MSDLSPDQKLYDCWQVTVCSACHTAACWQGVFYCQEYKSAGVEVKTIGDLKKLGPLESEDYWRRDEGVKCLLGLEQK